MDDTAPLNFLKASASIPGRKHWLLSEESSINEDVSHAFAFTVNLLPPKYIKPDSPPPFQPNSTATCFFVADVRVHV